jgi:MarR family transcriptional regulator, organic hydroperoxide resistance regulator
MRPAEQVRYLVLAAQREGNRILAQHLRPLGLTPSQAEVIRVLADHEPLTLSGVGELLVCESGTNPSRLVDRLVVGGLVRRAESAEDRRQVHLTLTVEGRALDAGVRAIESALYAQIDGLGEADAAILDYLTRLSAGTDAGAAVARRIAP